MKKKVNGEQMGDELGKMSISNVIGCHRQREIRTVLRLGICAFFDRLFCKLIIH